VSLGRLLDHHEARHPRGARPRAMPDRDLPEDDRGTAGVMSRQRGTCSDWSWIGDASIRASRQLEPSSQVRKADRASFAVLSKREVLSE
jgi:hypothetical protein